MVLGGLMLAPDRAVTVFGTLSPSDFYRSDHQAIAHAIRDMHDQRKKHDRVSLAAHLRDTGNLEAAGGDVYLLDLETNCYTVSSIERHAEIIRDRAHRRQVMALCYE